MSDSDSNTPPWLLDLVRQLDPKHRIGLDPCSNNHSMVDAKWNIMKAYNGLGIPWRQQGLVFMNPPHSHSPNNIEPWMEKAYQEFMMDPPGYHDSLDAFVGLIPAKTGPEWFHNHAAPFAAKCFLKGRIKFWLHGKETSGSGKFDSLIIYQGTQVGRFCQIFSPHGWVV